MTPHCEECAEREHGPAERARPCAVGDVYAMGDGRYLLVSDVWLAEPAGTVGRAKCLVGSWRAKRFVPTEPYQFALFGFAAGERLMFDCVGGIDADVARGYHTEEQGQPGTATPGG